jgi:hypothetical protein
MQQAAAGPRVTVYKADGCHLCEQALRVVEEVRAEREFELSVVDIGGDPELEARYREWLPVVEIDGRKEFVYYVQPADLRRRLDGLAQRQRLDRSFQTDTRAEPARPDDGTASGA